MKMNNLDLKLLIPVTLFIVLAGVALGLLMASARADRQPRQHEADYVDRWCEDAGGAAEYRLPDRTRVDCLLDDYAIEFDWTAKWGECIGQAAFYGEMTKKKSVCILIRRTKQQSRAFYRFARRAKTAARRADVIVICLSVAGEEISCAPSGRRETLELP